MNTNTVPAEQLNLISKYLLKYSGVQSEELYGGLLIAFTDGRASCLAELTQADADSLLNKMRSVRPTLN
jgi:hypothetical protein